MTIHPTVRFTEPPVTDTIAMDVDEPNQSQPSIDDLYLGPDEDIEDDLMPVGSSIADDRWHDSEMQSAQVSDRSHCSPMAEMTLHFSLDLYLGPDDDLPDGPEEPMPLLTNEELHAMAREFWPLGSYNHMGHEYPFQYNIAILF
ncbi:hypothetical protein F4604DRAFT_1914739 [Suillus subluteus]|nr:hypothetical protein F4604DRAFT_1914739 [Suillus subluteus]